MRPHLLAASALFLLACSTPPSRPGVTDPLADPGPESDVEVVEVVEVDDPDVTEDTEAADPGERSPDPGTEDDPGDTGGDDPDSGDCQADCANKECGDDGCEGLCGFCAVGLVCNALFQCAPECDPQCEGKFCGPDGCGGACGACLEGFECGADGKCYDVVCVPDCLDKVCGDDGCGGDCGECVFGDLCVNGECVIGPCSGIPEIGKCEDGNAVTCVDGQAVIQNCLALEEKMCGWDPALGYYACVTEEVCQPVCTGKQCGSDGCGGQCGVCPSGWPCEAGTCAPTEGASCGYFNEVGKCIENVRWYCSTATLFTQDCNKTGTTCGFDVEAQKNVCL